MAKYGSLTPTITRAPLGAAPERITRLPRCRFNEVGFSCGCAKCDARMDARAEQARERNTRTMARTMAERHTGGC